MPIIRWDTPRKFKRSPMPDYITALDNQQGDYAVVYEGVYRVWLGTTEYAWLEDHADDYERFVEFTNPAEDKSHLLFIPPSANVTVFVRRRP